MADPRRVRRVVFSFSALVGQDKMKLALILNAINPQIGGVLVRGEKGTGKSTAVRALAELLPEIETVEGCQFNCDPSNLSEMCPACKARFSGKGAQETVKRNLISRLFGRQRSPSSAPATIRRKMKVTDLPLGATEDRVVGSLDLERAVKEGKRVLEPGILAEANRGILYIDEINLLDDHVVDVLLDASTSGVNTVEREGISFSHPSRFILVGTMNPEEGEVRPQLLDRIALHVVVEGISNVDQRVEIVTRRNEFEKDPVTFVRKYEPQNEEMRNKIIEAKKLLEKVDFPEKTLMLICRMCKEVEVEGHRPDVMIAKTAKTLAAYDGRTLINEKDIKTAAEFILPYRMRAVPFEETEYAESEFIEKLIDELQSDLAFQDEPPPPPPPKEEEKKDKTQEIPTAVFSIGKPFELPRDMVRRRSDKTIRSGSGKRMKSLSTGRKGRYVKHRIPEEIPKDVAFDATIRAAAPYQMIRREKHLSKGMAVLIREPDLRKKVREDRVSTIIVLAVDASGSMGALKRMEAAKGAVLSLLMDAYQRRDRVAMVAFRGREAAVVLPPTSGVEMAKRLLTTLPTGGKTPISAGLMKAYNLIKNERRKDPTLVPLLVLITDGRANASIVEGADPMEEVEKMADMIKSERIYPVVIDTELPPSLSKFVEFTYGFAKDIADDLNGRYYKLDDLNAVSLGLLIHMEKSHLIGVAEKSKRERMKVPKSYQNQVAKDSQELDNRNWMK